MKLRTDILLGLVLIALSACKTVGQDPLGSTLQSNGVPLGQIRGFDFIARDLERIFGQEVASGLPDFYKEAEIKDLMGNFHLSVKKTNYLGGQPNAGNLVLWVVFFDVYLDQFLKIACEQESGAPGDGTEMLRVARQFCQPGEPLAATEPLAPKIFDQFGMISGDEFEPWHDRFWQEAVKDNMDGKAFFKEAVMALLIDPYFLLERQ